MKVQLKGGRFRCLVGTADSVEVAVGLEESVGGCGWFFARPGCKVVISIRMVLPFLCQLEATYVGVVAEVKVSLSLSLLAMGEVTSSQKLGLWF